MNKLNVKLKYCYGIKQFEYEFDFTNGNAILIYAQNGVMKTSFAKTFQNYRDDQESKDEYFPQRNSDNQREITDESGGEYPKDQIYVINTELSEVRNEKLSLLLTDSNLRGKYVELTEEIENGKKELLNSISRKTGHGRDFVSLEKLIISISDKDDFFSALDFIKQTCVEDTYLNSIKYTDLYNPKVDKFIEDNKATIEEYINQFNDLIKSSKIFKQGIFDNYNAVSVIDSLKKNKYFEAKHSINLNEDDSYKEIQSLDDFQSIVEKEKDRILSDDKLRKKFETIDKKITNNAELRIFKTIVQDSPEILSLRLNSSNELEKKLLLSYCHEYVSEVEKLLTIFRTNSEEISKIINAAHNQKTKWQEAVDIFNSRFLNLPFRVRIDNKKDVILQEVAPVFSFDYIDGSETRNLKKEHLISSLSRGEKRALYLMEIIFEIEARRKENREYLLVIDDVADSFDYKNKYAIIQYLKDLSEENNFKLIILTHNFDFYRSVHSRLAIPRVNCFMASREENGIILEDAAYLNNPIETFRKGCHSNIRLFLATIPLVRELIAIRYGKQHDDYLKLTSVLHVRQDSDSILTEDIYKIFDNYVQIQGVVSLDRSKKVIDLIDGEVLEILSDATNHSETSLEIKIVLSMGIRLKAEEYMIKAINDSSKVESIRNNQTVELFKLYSKIDSPDDEALTVLDRVNLMTPENIHVNSFMYEPLLDMSMSHLVSLYNDISKLIESVED